MAQEVEISSKRTDLLLEYGSSQTAQDRKEELAVKQQSAQDKINTLKREISLDEREQKGLILFENSHVTIHDDTASTVTSESGKTEYLVNCVNGTCSCKDHEFAGIHGIVCKHRIADKLARAAQGAEIEKNLKDNVVTFADM